MKKKIRIWITALLCGMLAFGCVISAGATEHTCVEHIVLTRFLGYRDNGGNHSAMYRRTYACQFCNKYMYTSDSFISENHKRNMYRDLGHQDDTTHKYEIYCGNCGGGQQQIYLITCDGHLTGHHTTPW